jgi:1-pyrroline-5-carboxylate dehydrogenase
MDAITKVPEPFNELVHDYAPGSPERLELQDRLKKLAAEDVELTMAIGGEHRLGDGDAISVVQPHRKDAKLGTLRDATADDVRQAVDAALAAAAGWQQLAFDERAAIFLKAADLLTGPWRARLNAATMLVRARPRTRPRSTPLRNGRLLAIQRWLCSTNLGGAAIEWLRCVEPS